MENIINQDFDIIRLNNDVNGNPRYCTHFLNFCDRSELDSRLLSIKDKYNIALMRAKTIGASKHRTKAIGGGIKWQSYQDNYSLIAGSFDAFKKSRLYYRADVDIALGFINDAKYALPMAEWAKQQVSKRTSYKPLEDVLVKVMDYTNGKRIAADVIWLAAVLILIYFEQQAIEDLNYSKTNKTE